LDGLDQSISAELMLADWAAPWLEVTWLEALWLVVPWLVALWVALCALGTQCSSHQDGKSLACSNHHFHLHL
jgi:hypothetical protein